MLIDSEMLQQRSNMLAGNGHISAMLVNGGNIPKLSSQEGEKVL